MYSARDWRNLSGAHRFNTDLSEKQVVALWEQLLASKVALTADSGESLTVVYPGRLNNERGADFRDVVIQSCRGIERGQIEFHLRSSDWWAHCHHLDPAYRQVVLHVVLWHDSEPVRHPAGSIFTITLLRYLDINLLRSLRLREKPVGIPVACRLQSVDSPSQLLAAVEAAGEARFQEKAARFFRELCCANPGQVLYRGVMGALGYVQNQQPCRELADRVPLAELVSLNSSEASISIVMLRMLALLLGTAGFLPARRIGQTKNLNGWLEHIWSGYSPRHVMIDRDWCLFKVRPANAPERRIIAMACLVLRYREKGFLTSLVGQIESITSDNISNLREGFIATAAQCREICLDAGPAYCDNNPTLIGAGRASEIVENILLPFAYAWGRYTSRQALLSSALNLFRRFPGSPANALERHTAKQLGLRGRMVNSAMRQQGLQYIHRVLCSRGKCSECPLVQKLTSA